MSRSPHYIRLMNSRRWRALRMATIKRAKGLCEQCSAEGRVSAATEVHHIRPVESIKDPFVMEQLAYDPTNLKALCHYCHRQIHMDMHKGTKEEHRRRTKEDVDSFHQLMFGEDPLL